MAITEDLKSSIERLYEVFSRYPFPSTMDGCPCCVSAGDKEKMHTKPLRQLQGDDISRYALKAMTTWGYVEDFKYYLPRIFELAATTEFIVDTFVVLGKLDYGKWKEWETNEIESINNFLLAWWTNSIRHKSHFDRELLIEISKKTGDVQTLFDKWELSFENNSYSNFIEFVYEDFNDILNKKNTYKEFETGATDKILTWIFSKKSWLEDGFFKFEKSNPDFAEQISNSLYAIDRMPPIKGK